MKLYEISTELAAILHTDDDGELSDDIAERLTALEIAFDAKVEGVLQHRQELILDAHAIDCEVERLQARADALARRAEWLKGYVHGEMTRCGIGKVSTLTFTATVAKSPPKAELVGDEIPAEYRREKLTVEFDKKAVIEDHKSGKPLPECVRISQGTNLRIA